jgi:hypothetical protein
MAVTSGPIPSTTTILSFICHMCLRGKLPQPIRWRAMHNSVSTANTLRGWDNPLPVTGGPIQSAPRRFTSSLQLRSSDLDAGVSPLHLRLACCHSRDSTIADYLVAFGLRPIMTSVWFAARNTLLGCEQFGCWHTASPCLWRVGVATVVVVNEAPLLQTGVFGCGCKGFLYPHIPWYPIEETWSWCKQGCNTNRSTLSVSEWKQLYRYRKIPNATQCT